MGSRKIDGQSHQPVRPIMLACLGVESGAPCWSCFIPGISYVRSFKLSVVGDCARKAAVPSPFFGDPRCISVAGSATRLHGVERG